MTEYQQKFFTRLRNSKEWPAFQRPDFLQVLNDFADQANASQSIEGHLAALLVYQQLVEEMACVLIDCSTFYMQCRVFPEEFYGPRRGRRMFGQLLSDLESGVMNDNIRQILFKCRSLNNLRIRMVHKITLKTSLSEVKIQASRAKCLFDQIYIIFNDIYDIYRVTFSHHLKDITELEEMAKDTLNMD